MITRITDNIINKHAVNNFTSETISSKSWFTQIRQICLRYGLPHPLVLLQNPLSKDDFKKLIKQHVINYWELVLRSEAALLPSLKYFHSSYMSLTKPHPIWTSAGSSPAKIAMATVQARMLSGRYRTELLCSHWSNNKSGKCLISENCLDTTEDLEHILVSCDALHPTRLKLSDYTNTLQCTHAIKHIIDKYCNPSSPSFCQFLLDCSVLPEVISAVQSEGQFIHEILFNITRTWVYTLHKERMKLLGRWNFI